MLTLTFSCLLAAIGPIMFPLILGGLALSSGDSSSNIVNISPVAFIAYGYFTMMLSLAYGILTRLGKIKARWWKSLLLFIFNMIVLPIVIIIAIAKMADINGAVEDGVAQISTQYLNYLIISLATFICGIFLKPTPKPSLAEDG